MIDLNSSQWGGISAPHRGVGPLPLGQAGINNRNPDLPNTYHQSRTANAAAERMQKLVGQFRE